MSQDGPLLGEGADQPQADEKVGLACEQDDKCCLCIPIETGLKFVAFSHIALGIMYVSLGGVLSNIDWYAGLIFYLVSLPWFGACWIFTKWLIRDSKEHRNQLSLAVWLAFATVVVGASV